MKVVINRLSNRRLTVNADHVERVTTCWDVAHAVVCGTPLGRTAAATV
jgi:hypothetical protein